MNYKLMTPGPVPLPDWVLKELAEPVLHHRTNEFEAILARVLAHLKKVFMTKEHCMVLTGSGTGGMEAALTNCVQRGDTVISIDTGKFGQRWHEMAASLGYKSVRLQFNWGEAVDLQKIKDTLLAHPHAKAVLCQASETSTGALLPVKEIANLTAKTETLLIVDAVTALGALPLPMDEWGLDVVITGSQKALMMPTGLTLISLSKKAWQKAETIAPKQTYYWNLVDERNANEKTQTRFSSAVSLIRCLDVVLKHIDKIGIPALFDQHTERAQIFRKQVLKNGVTLFPKKPSPSLSCLNMPAGVNSQKVQEIMQDKHKIVIMGGQDQLKGKVVRVGHMGWMTKEDLIETADRLHEVINEVKKNGTKSV